VKVDAFPVDDVIPRASYGEIIDRLKLFEMDWTAPCDRCKFIDWVSNLPHAGLSLQATIDCQQVYLVLMAASAAEKYFDGLCLDCMHRSKVQKGQDADTEYWVSNVHVRTPYETLLTSYLNILGAQCEQGWSLGHEL
jgi:hypothetical protein